MIRHIGIPPSFDAAVICGGNESMSLLDILAYLASGALVCGGIGLGVAVNHEASAKAGFIIGAVIGVAMITVGLVKGVFPSYF